MSNSKISRRIIGKFGTLLKREIPNKKETALLPKKVVGNLKVTPLTEDVAEISPKPQNSMLNELLKMLRKEGVSEKVIGQFLNNERPRMYRFIGREELEKLFKGEVVTSTRPCRNGVSTDITSNPDYGKIPREGKYRIAFKDIENFAPFSNEPDSRVSIHSMKNEEYYLTGGYSLEDIEKIETYSSGCYTPVYPNKYSS